MKVNNEAITIARYISEFLKEYVPLHKTSSANTQRVYHQSITLYLTFLEEEKAIRPNKFRGDCFERIVIEEWLVWLSKHRRCSPRTCNSRLSSLRVFLKYLGSRDVIYLYLSQEAAGIPRRTEQKKKVEGLSRNAVTALLAAPNTTTRTGRRDIVFMILLYATATRLDEILSLKNRNLKLDGENPYITVIGKGNKIRTLYLLPKAVAHLKKYLKEFHGCTPEPNAYVFYSRNVGIHGKMTQPAIAKMLRKHAKTAHKVCVEVPLDLHAHRFRHAKASHWLEDGMNIVQISFLLGHEQLQTTMVYLDITNEEKAKALATLEDENDKKVLPKWKSESNSIIDLCGLRGRND